jgi:hypothetical protein
MLGALALRKAEPGNSIVFSREVIGLRPTDPWPEWPRFLRSLCMGRLQMRLWMTLVTNVNRALRVAIYDLPDNFRAVPFLANQERHRVVGLT